MWTVDTQNVDSDKVQKSPDVQHIGSWLLERNLYFIKRTLEFHASGSQIACIKNMKKLVKSHHIFIFKINALRISLKLTRVTFLSYCHLGVEDKPLLIF